MLHTDMNFLLENPIPAGRWRKVRDGDRANVGVIRKCSTQFEWRTPSADGWANTRKAALEAIKAANSKRQALDLAERAYRTRVSTLLEPLRSARRECDSAAVELMRERHRYPARADDLAYAEKRWRRAEANLAAIEGSFKLEAA